MATFNSKSISKFASKSDIIKIITITSLFFVTLQFTRLTFLINGESDAPFYTNLYSKFALPLNFGQLIRQPWTLLTYLFSELNFMRLLGNMIWLWVFATVIEDLKGSNRILPIFITGGLVGALFMLGYSSIRPGAMIQPYAGSLAALSAVAMAALIYKPQYKFSMFFGLEIPIWVFVAIFFALNMVTIEKYTLPLFFMVLGGMLTGLAYTTILHSYFEGFTAMLFKAGNYMGNNDNFILEKEASNRNKSMLNLSYKKNGEKEMTMDALLDKINEKGIDSLTKEERKRLEEFSKKP